MRSRNLAGAAAIAMAVALGAPESASAGGRHVYHYYGAPVPHVHGHYPSYGYHRVAPPVQAPYHGAVAEPAPRHYAEPAPHHHEEFVYIRKPRKYFRRLRRLHRRHYFHY